MLIREHQENQEYEVLSLFAAKSRDSRGRRFYSEPCPIRTSYQRDRDRIIHCKSFRRLKHKTQVFIAPEGDHFRTRLTHTLEVAQVARTLARALRLNEDLTEAVALAHDLGHTPFGHIGEHVLNTLIPNGFRHNEQSLRMVDHLEGTMPKALNLTYEVRDGILHHSGSKMPETLEGVCVSIADRIAYIHHDIDDALRAGLLTVQDLPEECVSVLGQTHGQRMNTMVIDIVNASYEKEQVVMSDNIAHAVGVLRDFLFKRVYHEAWRAKEEEKCKHVIEALFNHFINHVDNMPEEYKHIADQEGSIQGVCDFIACMTDRYALRVYENLYIPSCFPMV